MWDPVRRELALLEWGTGPETSRPGLLADWVATVPALLAARHALGPVSDPADPFAVLARVTRGAQNAAGGVEPLPAPTLTRLRAALTEAAASAAHSPADRPDQLAGLFQVGYRLAHWAGARVPLNHPARAWLLTAETVLDGAVHAPAARTPLARGLAGWQNALVEVQGRREPLFRRGATAGHLGILTSARTDLEEATRRGLLPPGYGQSVVDAVGRLSVAHRAALASRPRLTGRPTAADELLMLRLGRSARDLTGPRGAPTELAGRVDALLRSTLAHAPLVAALTADPTSARAVGRLHHLTLEYLTHPELLTPTGPRRPTRAPAPPPPPPPAPVPALAPVEPVRATIPHGTVLDRDTIVALCRARDLGRAAAGADPAQPPELLRGTDPATWPALAQTGRQAVADLVASVTPMVYAHTRHGPNLDDLRGELFVALTRAAYRYDPRHSGGGSWSTYAWRTLQHQRWTGVDDAGVARTRRTLRTLPMGDREPVSQAPSPEDLVLPTERSHDSVAAAVAALPTDLRRPLEGSMDGQPPRLIAEHLHISTSTVHRRIKAARALLHDQLTQPDPDPGPGPQPRLWETVTRAPTPPPDPLPPLQPPGRPAPPR